jgi:hypothetical protein
MEYNKMIHNPFYYPHEIKKELRKVAHHNVSLFFSLYPNLFHKSH